MQRAIVPSLNGAPADVFTLFQPVDIQSLDPYGIIFVSSQQAWLYQ